MCHPPISIIFVKTFLVAFLVVCLIHCILLLLPGPGVAGYLTAGTGATVMPNVPPPVDNDIGDLG